MANCYKCGVGDTVMKCICESCTKDLQAKIKRLAELEQRLANRQIIELPAALGSPIYIPYLTPDVDGTTMEGIEVGILTGYMDDGLEAVYLYIDEFGHEGTIEASNTFTSYRIAEFVLNARKDGAPEEDIKKVLAVLQGKYEKKSAGYVTPEFELAIKGMS